MKNRKFRKASVIILAGSSAGGIGVINNIDTIARQVAKKNRKIKIRGIVDSSIFLLKNSEQAGELDLGLDYWNSIANKKCLARTNSATECTTGHQSLNISEIKIEMSILHNQFCSKVSISNKKLRR